MRHYFRNFSNCFAVILLAGLAGCGGSKIIKNPEAAELAGPLAAASDEHLSLAVDWAVVRNGPGSWVTNADWDEYRIRIANTSEHRLQVNSVNLYDGLDTELVTSGERRALIRGSKAAARRFRDEGLQVRAGMGAPMLVGAGAASYVAGSALGVAVLGGSASAGAAGVAIGALAAAPVLVVSGVVVGMKNSRIANEIAERQVTLPLLLESGKAATVSAFFPLAPSPNRLVVHYRAAGLDRLLAVDISDALDGLHLLTDDERPSSAPNGDPVPKDAADEQRAGTAP